MDKQIIKIVKDKRTEVVAHPFFVALSKEIINQSWICHPQLDHHHLKR
jgi:hypothetical protein